MDTTAKLWCLENMKLLYTFDEHCGEIISLTFDTMVISPDPTGNNFIFRVADC